MGQSQLLDADQVLVPELVAVTAHVSVLIPQHSAFLVAEGVPDTGTLPVGPPATSVDVNNVYMSQNYADTSVKRDRFKAEVVKKTRLLFYTFALLFMAVLSVAMEINCVYKIALSRVSHSVQSIFKEQDFSFGCCVFHITCSNEQFGKRTGTNVQFNSRIHYLICFTSDLHDLPSI